jgi:hypothetical protein
MKIKVLPDGTATLTSTGVQPTLIRTCNEVQCTPWSPLYRRDTIAVTESMQVSVDSSNPESNIFSISPESGGQGGYGQQQGGYGQQQGGYGQQQGGYGQQQGGYGQQQGGYGQQQGGW